MAKREHNNGWRKETNSRGTIANPHGNRKERRAAKQLKHVCHKCKNGTCQEVGNG